MLSRSVPCLGPVSSKPSFYHFKANQAFPLLQTGNLLSKIQVGRYDFQGSRSFDDDHQIAICPKDFKDRPIFHKFSDWEKHLNPQLYNNHGAVTPTPEYVGQRTGRYNPVLGWLKIGGTRKFKKFEEYNKFRKHLAYGLWVEGRHATPAYRTVPKIGAHGPNYRFEGKLVYTDLKLSKLIWAIDAGILNRNEVITLHVLRNTGLLEERQIVWPGVCVVIGDMTELKYPIKLELQRAHPEVIRLVEKAGGSFVSSYLSPEGLYQELHPEEFPTFLDQNMPDNHSFANVHSLPSERGYLAQWYDDEGKYAHPSAGRRQSHYVRPPHQRDFPATFEEYDRVKHYQKFHFEMPGTGTELPWYRDSTADHAKKTTGPVGY